MPDPNEIREWLDKSEEDLRVSEILLESGQELTLPCMFHLQQMLEKSLKAVIIASGQPIDRTHDLDRLAGMANVRDMEGLLDLCDVLNQFAVNGRYPGDHPIVSIRDAQRYYGEAVALRKKLCERIEPC